MKILQAYEAASLAERVRFWRQVKRWTLKEFAHKAGVPIPTIADVEQGRFKPTLDLLYKVATALDVPVTELIPNQPPSVAAQHGEE